MREHVRTGLFGCLALLTALCAGCGGSGGVSDNSSGVVNTIAALDASVSTLAPGASVQIVLTNRSSSPIEAPVVTLAPWLQAITLNPRLQATDALWPGASVTLSFDLGADSITDQALTNHYQHILSNPRSDVLVVTSANLNTRIKPDLLVNATASPTYRNLMQDVLINADLWDDTARIMSADYAFEGIQGVGTLSDTKTNESAVIAAGGAWQTIATPNAPPTAFTTAITPANVYQTFGYPTYLADALPVCFSWPVLPSTVDRQSFAVTLNTGAVVKPYVTSIVPNHEYNERACVVLFGEFGNRLAPDANDAVYPTMVSIVAGKRQLMLVGPSGPVSAVGLSKASSHPYVSNAGPTLSAAKLSVMSVRGEGGPAAFSGLINNDCISIYGPTVQYRLRTFSTGGTAPDGVAAILPTDFGDYFRLQVTRPDGQISWITRSGTPLDMPEGRIEVLGLADLGRQGTPFNDAYVADRDNHIDICIRGDLAAVNLITGLDMPASNGYKRFFNPGGPGNNPRPGVTYTQPGAPQFLTVIRALNDPRTVSYP